eukprot:2058186-Pyramimonas_sp.AAC.1
MALDKISAVQADVTESKTMLEAAKHSLDATTRSHDAVLQLVHELRQGRAAQQAERGPGPLPQSWRNPE